MLRGADNGIHHAAGARHIRFGNLEKLARVTTGNQIFRELLVCRKGRRDYQLQNGDLITQADRYFQVDSRNHYLLNRLRIRGREKYRLGEDHHALCNSIVAKTMPAQVQCSETLQTGLNRCRAQLQAMVRQGAAYGPEKKSDMRVLLLAETLARQLNEIGHVQDRASAGQEIVHTLAWIDALLASHELAPIGIGGQLKKERSACAEDRQRNVESLAHRQPIVTAMCSDGAAGAARTSALADFNDMLQKVRNELIGTEVDMALESCVSEADMQWADIYAAIQGMDRQIAEIHGQRFSGKLVTGSNLDKSSDAVSNICIQTQHHFADGIEPVLTQLDARVAWADGIAAAGAELEALCADIPHGTSAERRLAWEAQLRQWADKFDSLPLPNGSGKLGEMLGPRLGQALTALSSVTTDSEARRLQGFATRDLPWCDRALAALDQCSASLFNPGGVLDEYVRLVPEKGVARKSHEKLGKHGMKMAEYNAHVAIENSAMEGVISRRLNEFNRKNQDRSKTATASIASIGLKGHNDYIAHLKEHIREDGTKNLLDRSYDVLIDSVERARGCAKRLCRHLILPTDNRGSVLYDKVESLDKAVQETLEKQRQFTGMRLLSRHREILRELYVPHLQRYAYFDHPDYTLLKNNMQETASSARFQETVARQIELHGSPLYFSPTTPRFVGLVGPLASLGTRTDAQAT